MGTRSTRAVIHVLTATLAVAILLTATAAESAGGYVLWGRERDTGKIEKKASAWDSIRCLELKRTLEASGARYWDYACVKEGLDPKTEVARWK